MDAPTIQVMNGISAVGTRVWPAATVGTAAMAASMAVLYAVSGLGPFLVAELGLSRTQLGGLVAVTFAVAAVTSLFAGHLVDLAGPRRGLLALFTVVSVALVAASLADSYAWLVAALAVGGVGQALANPATNLLIVNQVPQRRRGLAIGLKQSGVQLAAVGGGAVLPLVAGVAGWRVALACTVLLPVASAVLLLVVFAPDVRRPVAGPWWRWPRPSAWLIPLMGYSLLLGTALAAVNTYLPLYAVQQLGFADRSAGLVLVALGLAGLVARVWWTRWADRRRDVTRVLVWLSVAASIAAAVASAAHLAPPLVWLAAVGVGATATGANALSMLAVVRRATAAGHASAMVSLGFFGGFVIGPATFGLVADLAGYSAAWGVVTVAFVGSALVAISLKDAPRPLGAPT